MSTQEKNLLRNEQKIDGKSLSRSCRARPSYGKSQTESVGLFCSEEGSRYFCRIRGFISTVKKQGKNVLEYLCKAFESYNANSSLSQEE